ncbi:MAG TPA: hypothetical protein VJ548_04885 [Azospira sp.]|nr:hypothetical protein [Azospira sp.]
MKKQNVLLSALLFATLASPLLAQAQNAMPRVDQREVNQERRIDQGVQSGALTGREANRLEKGQARVERMETRAEADGRVTGRERARMDQAQDRQSRHIAEQKRDRQTDFNHDGRNDNQGRRVGRWDDHGEARHVGPREGRSRR